MASPPPALGEFEAISFDCYGTLIDWETGLLNALEPLISRASTRPQSNEVLEAYAVAEAKAEEEWPSDPYRQILSRVWRDLSALWNAEDDPTERERFAQSVGEWPVFADTVKALKRLKRRHKLIILSNVDRESFARTNQMLEVQFDRILTAQDIGSYKPDPRSFEALLAAVEAMGIAPAKLLHVAQSLYHDHVPAKAAGIPTAWINRRADQEGGGATLAPAAAVYPDYTFATLAALADAIDSGVRD
jgi:2-haloalkanoic acid dehalogenase type II